VRFENAFYICTPQNTEALWETGRKIKEKEIEKISKKTLNFSCEKQKEVLVLHPLWETSEDKKKHVRRHIELTAVLREILKQKNKSKGIERFEKNH